MTAPEQLASPADQGARARVLVVLRLMLAGFLVGVLATQPPGDHLWLCWLIVACYVAWSVATALIARSGGSDLLPYV